MHTFLHKSIVSIATLVASVFGVYPQAPVVAPAPIVQSSPILGAAPSPVALSTFNLAGAGVSSSATSINFTSLTIKQTGQKIQTTDLKQGASDTFYVTLEPGNSTKQEIVGCTDVTQNANGSATLTGCSRGLSPIYPYLASTTLRFVHAGGSQAIFGDAPQLFNDILNYVASTSYAGTVDASLTVKGIVEQATAAEAASHAQTGTGGTSAPLALTSSISSSTRVANTSVVVVSSSTNGYIDNSFIATSTLFTNVTLNGTTTINFASTTDSVTGYQSMWYLIASSTLGANASSINITNLPNRKMLQLYWTGAGISDIPIFAFNGDYDLGNSKRDYNYQATSSGSDSGYIPITPSGFLGATSTLMATIQMLDSTHARVSGFGSVGTAATTTAPANYTVAAKWATSTPQTNGITSIIFTTVSSNLIKGSSVYIYGSAF